MKRSFVIGILFIWAGGTIAISAVVRARATIEALAESSAETYAARSQKPLPKPQPVDKTEPGKSANNLLNEAEMKKLQGAWQVIRWEDESGQPASADEMKDFTLSFDGDVLTMRKGKDDPGTKCQFRIDPAKLPKWIDMGMPAISEGATVLEGIYSLEGDALSLCITSGLMNNVPPPRPTEFKTKPNEKYAVLVLTRIH
jgi:uncharacterized protein (TIGR03067 family)